jgi:hypothetical protein
MLSVAGLEKSKLDALCKEAAAKEAWQGNWMKLASGCSGCSGV